MRDSSYSAVLATLLEELAGLQVFLLSCKVQSNALVVLLRRLWTWLTHNSTQLTDLSLTLHYERNQ